MAIGGAFRDALEREELKDRVGKAFDRWIKRLGLAWWRIDIDYTDGAVGQHQDPSGRVHTVMLCEAQWEYMQATITVSLPQCIRASDEELERFALHELMHVFLAETREPVYEDCKHEERVACTLTNAFLWLRDAALGGELEEQTPHSPECEAGYVEGSEYDLQHRGGDG